MVFITSALISPSGGSYPSLHIIYDFNGLSKNYPVCRDNHQRYLALA